MEQDEDSGSVWISQPVYTENLFFMNFGMQDCKPVSGPTIIPINSGQSDVGTRPDITYAVSNLARFSVKLRITGMQ